MNILFLVGDFAAYPCIHDQLYSSLSVKVFDIAPSMNNRVVWTSASKQVWTFLAHNFPVFSICCFPCVEGLQIMRSIWITKSLSWSMFFNACTLLLSGSWQLFLFLRTTKTLSNCQSYAMTIQMRRFTMLSKFVNFGLTTNEIGLSAMQCKRYGRK